MEQDTERFMDVNVAAGGLQNVFAFDVTMAACECAHCGKSMPLAEAFVYAMEPGLVVRCIGCRGVLMRVAAAPDRAWLDLRGMRFLQFPVAATL